MGYLEDGEDLKVSLTELQEQQVISEEAGVSIKQVAQQARNANCERFFQTFQARKRRFMHCQLGQMEAERSGGVGKRCQKMRQEVELLSERQEILNGMVEDKIRLQSRATEKNYEQILEEMKELEEKKTKRGSASCAEK